VTVDVDVVFRKGLERGEVLSNLKAMKGIIRLLDLAHEQ